MTANLMHAEFGTEFTERGATSKLILDHLVDIVSKTTQQPEGEGHVRSNKRRGEDLHGRVDRLLLYKKARETHFGVQFIESINQQVVGLHISQDSRDDADAKGLFVHSGEHYGDSEP